MSSLVEHDATGALAESRPFDLVTRDAALAAAALVLYWGAADIRLYGMRDSMVLGSGGSTLVGTAGMIVGMVIGMALFTRLDRRPVLVAMLSLPLVSTLLFFIMGSGFIASDAPIIIISRFIAGTGLGTILFLSGSLLLEGSIISAGVLAVISLAVGKFLFFCISASPYPMLMVLGSVFILIATVLLACAFLSPSHLHRGTFEALRSCKDAPVDAHGPDPASDGRTRPSDRGVLISFSIGLFFYSLIYGTVISFALHGANSESIMTPVGTVMCVSAAVVAVVVCLRPQINIELFQWWLFVPIAVCLLLIILRPIDTTLTLLVVVAVFTLYDCSSMMSLMTIAGVRSSIVDRVQGFAIGRSANFGGMLAGSGLYLVFSTVAMEGGSDRYIVILIALEFVFLIMGMAFLGRTSFNFNTVPGISGSVADGSATTGASEELAQPFSVDGWITACGLSDRESDVLNLLCQGRSSTIIAERLYVSQSTAKTYISRIYQKLGVHSRQELLDLLEHGSPDTVQGKEGAER